MRNEKMLVNEQWKDNKSNIFDGINWYEKDYMDINRY